MYDFKIATMPKGSVALTSAGAGGPRIVQTAPGKQIPHQIVKLVNAQGQPGTNRSSVTDPDSEPGPHTLGHSGSVS